jgi:hypothetical protein
MDHAVGVERLPDFNHGHLAGIAPVEIFADRFADPRRDARPERIADFHVFTRYAQRHRKLTFLFRIAALPEFIPATTGYKASGVAFTPIFSPNLG